MEGGRKVGRWGGREGITNDFFKRVYQLYIIYAKALHVGGRV